MAYTDTLPLSGRFGQTARRDAWWVQPLLVFLGLSTFIVYSTWAAFHPLYQGNRAYWCHANGANYLSPFFSPEIFGSSPHSWFGPAPGWWPAWLPLSPRLSDSLGAGGLSVHLLLLPRRLLQGVLGRPAGLRRRRAAQGFSR